jgi:hypothetical protein
MRFLNSASAHRTVPASFLLIGLLILMSCKQEPVIPDTGSVHFSLQYTVDEQPVVFDTIRYVNEAGNAFSVTRLEYFISEVVLVDSEGKEYRSDEVFYVNPRKYGDFQLTVPDVSLKDYTSLRFVVGLAGANNESFALGADPDKMNMFWPEPMGGGYHFLKFEGHFIDSTGAQLGYAMHLGTPFCLTYCQIEQPFSLNDDNEVLTLEMNLNEWFRDPTIYDLNTAGYIMGNMPLMQQIAENGGDIFKLK